MAKSKCRPAAIYFELSMPLQLFLTLSQETSRFLWKQNYQNRNPSEPVITAHNIRYNKETYMY